MVFRMDQHFVYYHRQDLKTHGTYSLNMLSKTGCLIIISFNFILNWYAGILHTTDEESLPLLSSSLTVCLLVCLQISHSLTTITLSLCLSCSHLHFVFITTVVNGHKTRDNDNMVKSLLTFLNERLTRFTFRPFLRHLFVCDRRSMLLKVLGGPGETCCDRVDG